jgi:hypothetical protein
MASTRTTEWPCDGIGVFFSGSSILSFIIQPFFTPISNITWLASIYDSEQHNTVIAAFSAPDGVMGMGPGGHRDTKEASWGVNFLSGTSTSLMSRSAMSASSKPLFQHSARHTQPHGYVASGDDELTANDSLTFELGRRLNIGLRRILTRLMAAFLLGQGWNQHIFFFSSGLLVPF